MATSIAQGLKAAADIQKFVTPASNPVAWNTSIALLALLQAADLEARRWEWLKKGLDPNGLASPNFPKS
ncbi:MAG: hypothetical protein DI533_04675 [Cereibacter sphaeroides]|uniref:Uncharacterized protein n=1 Tax=Cereibacter sphaeroides TaxID=1063 RepID=A0A2W5SCV7_CERSP|nr:MAG: hypothetical protein DI533_04675 [Cereibacter sphaeroides]